MTLNPELSPEMRNGNGRYLLCGRMIPALQPKTRESSGLNDPRARAKARVLSNLAQHQIVGNPTSILRDNSSQHFVYTRE